MQKRNEEIEITDSELLIKEATKLSKEIKGAEPCPITEKKGSCDCND